MNPSLTLILATLLYSAIHSLTASNPVKERVFKRFGPAARRWYRLGYNLWAGVSFLPILWLLVSLADQVVYVLPMPWALLAAGGQLAGALLILVGIRQTGGLSFLGIRQLASPERPEVETALIQTGLYAWVRHPLYTAGLVVIWFMPIMTRNMLTLSLVLSLYLVVGARLEEKRLLQAYGEAYVEYQQKVPLLLPRLRKPRP
ncbi:MAG: isoprenylcysteine carboxylmethyltransferase family protein [Anaerolineales bacterium]|nr:isoprenylcysteine carboxylmethyltransferase family protein [Anaerolineales bacterium]